MCSKSFVDLEDVLAHTMYFVHPESLDILVLATKYIVVMNNVPALVRDGLVQTLTLFI